MRENDRVLIDAGPLVALVNRRDEHHAWAVAQLRGITPPLETCESALAEAMHLLESRTNNAQVLRRMLERRLVEVNFSLLAELPAIIGLLDRYSNVPMSLADACLVRMCELNNSATLFTTDSDFHIYRKHGREALPLLIPSKS